jgi:hypothetical protein
LLSSSGELLGTAYGNKFTSSLIYADKMMPAGKYLIMVSPIWN